MTSIGSSSSVDCAIEIFKPHSEFRLQNRALKYRSYFKAKEMKVVLMYMFPRIFCLCMSVINLVDSHAEKIFDRNGLRKKCSIRCQILCSRNWLSAFSRKIVFPSSQGLIQLI